MPPYFSFAGTGDPLGKRLNNTRTRQEIGWEPKYTSFAHFLETIWLTAEWIFGVEINKFHQYFLHVDIVYKKIISVVIWKHKCLIYIMIASNINNILQGYSLVPDKNF